MIFSLLLEVYSNDAWHGEPQNQSLVHREYASSVLVMESSISDLFHFDTDLDPFWRIIDPDLLLPICYPDIHETVLDPEPGHQNETDPQYW